VNAPHVPRRIDPAHPGCLILLIDESSSMGGGLAGGQPSKADAMADAIHRYLGDLVALCTRGTDQLLPLLEVGLIAYAFPAAGQPVALVDRILQGLRDDRAIGGLVRIDDADHNPPGADGRAAVTIWRSGPEDVAGREGPFVGAFRYARDRAGAWCAAHADSPPPVVIHVTDGASDTGDTEPAARELMALGTSGGPLWLFHLHLASTPSAGVGFPAPDAAIDEPLVRRLLQITSALPAVLRARVE
jgi:hypothetical protein